MSAKIVEARLVISGDDRGASAAVANVVKAVRQMEEAAKVSQPLRQVAQSLLEIEKAERAVNSAMAGRNGLAALQGDLQKSQAALAQTATALDAARRAKSAFDGVKLVKGSQEAQAAQNAAKAVREAGAAYRAAERDVRKVNAAISAQTTTVQQAERAVTALGLDLGQLEAHQNRLRTSTENATSALRQQVRVEEQAARAAAHHAREQDEYQRHMRRHGAVGAAASAAAGYVGVHTVTHEIGDTLKAGARYQHEVVALKNAGRTPAEMKEIEHASSETIKKVPTATFLENLKVVNETTGAFGSVEHALEHLTFMQKAAAAVHASAGDKIHDDAGEMGNKLARFAEERGSAGDGERFERESEGLVRAMVFTRGNFNPHEMMNFAQQAKSSLQSYNERFLTGIMPSIVTTMKGERAGTAANAFNSVIDGKVNDRKQAEEWAKYGLLDTRQAIMKAGHAVGWRTGAIKDTALAHADPLQWMETVVLPALRKKGVDTDDKEALKKVLATMFRNTNANFFANELGQRDMRSRLHKDEKLMKSVGSLDEIYQRNLATDAQEALKAVTASLENLMTTASSPMMETAAAGLRTVATGIQSVALAAKEHPNIAMGAGGAAAVGGLAATGYLSYKLMTGFGLTGSASALTASAAALDAAALKLAGVPGSTLPAAAKGVPAFVGFGLGASTMGVLGAGAFAGYATAQTMPGVVKEKGPGGMDAATGGSVEESPMTGLAPDRPWLADWWRSHAPVILGGEPAKEAVREAGKDAGHAAGEGVATGVREKSPEIEAQGKSLFERFKAIFAEGIRIPIGFTPGDGAAGGGGDGRGLIHRASFGGVDSGGGSGVGGIVRGGRAGGGAGGGSGSGGFGGSGGAVHRGGLDLSTKGADPEVAAYIREAAKRNGIDPDVATAVANSEALRAFDPKKPDRGGDNGTSFGPFQLHYGGGTGANRQRGLGDRFTEQTGKDARDASTWRDQVDFALKTAKREGWGAWHGARNTGIGPWDGLRGDGAGLRVKGGPGGQAFGGGETHPSLLAIAKDLQKAGGVNRFTAFNDRYHAGTRSKHASGLAADVTGDPARIMANAREVMAAAGMLEGRDFRLIDEYARPSAGATGGHVHFEFRSRRAADAFARGRDLDRPPPGPKMPDGKPMEVPDAPAGGLGGAGGRGDMAAAAERMHAAVDRMENVGWRSHHTVEVSAGPGLQARTKGMRVSASGPVKADVGVTMPGARGGDWI